MVFRIVPATGETRYLRVQGHTVLHADMSPRSIRGAALDATKEMEVDRAKTEFASLASHQLKTPLSAISWLSEGLLSPKADPLSDKQRTFITSIHQESHQMTAIVNELLNVSRIELGTFGVALEEVDVCEMATSVVQEQQHTADAKHISVTLICAPDVPHLNADKSLVRMVIQNLISNAIKYTPDEGKVTCEITYENIGHEIVIVRVSDTGIGIPRDQRDNVFKKLYRAPNAKAYAPDGTGLGLYVVKNVVDRAGGTITFDSREGSGTAFNVSLPRYWGKGSGAQIPTAQMQAPEKDAILSRIWKHLRRKQS